MNQTIGLWGSFKGKMAKAMGDATGAHILNTELHLRRQGRTLHMVSETEGQRAFFASHTASFNSRPQIYPSHCTVEQ